jgi:hypothetical protein
MKMKGLVEWVIAIMDEGRKFIGPRRFVIWNMPIFLRRSLCLQRGLNLLLILPLLFKAHLYGTKLVMRLKEKGPSFQHVK